MSALTELHRLGQSIWLDNLSRSHLREGILARLIGLVEVDADGRLAPKRLTADRGPVA